MKRWFIVLFTLMLVAVSGFAGAEESPFGRITLDPFDDPLTKSEHYLLPFQKEPFWFNIAEVFEGGSCDKFGWSWKDEAEFRPWVLPGELPWSFSRLGIYLGREQAHGDNNIVGWDIESFLAGLSLTHQEKDWQVLFRVLYRNYVQEDQSLLLPYKSRSEYQQIKFETVISVFYLSHNPSPFYNCEA